MAEENKDLFEKIGVEIGNGKLNIDINKTKEFFNALKDTFENGAKNIQKDIAEGKLDMSENIGIKVDKKNINIDLEKTKVFIESLGHKIENFLTEIEKSVDDMNKK